MEEGIVYLLTNPAMPGLVKIGMTSRLEVEFRMNELFSTGVPVPFKCVYAGKTSNPDKVESSLHQAFGPYRINPKREFFEIEVEQAAVILRMICSEEVTPQVVREIDKTDKVSMDAGKILEKKRRPRFNFLEMGIFPGIVLNFTQGEATCEVIDEKKVKYLGETMSLTKATKTVLKNEYNVAPNGYWLFEGRRLNEIYNETYPFNSEG
jgi:hypothetical protein